MTLLITTIRCDLCSVLTAVIVTTVAATRSWGEVSMDRMDDCQQVRRPKHDMTEGDVFVVKSDGYNGKAMSADQRQPAECSIGFNFGDRLLSALVIDWSCDHSYSEPFLAFYADCDGSRKTLLTQLNCSSAKPISAIGSSTSCMSLYHFRGHRKGGYYFLLHVVAGYERIAFPAGGIAAIVIATVVVMMVAAKVICVVTGYDHHIPIDCDLDDDDVDGSKRMCINSNYSRSSIGACSTTSDHQVATVALPSVDFTDPAAVGGADNGFTLGSNSDQCNVPNAVHHPHHQQQQHPRHCQYQASSQPPCVTRSNGSAARPGVSSTAANAAAMSAAVELAASCNFDLDFLDLPTEDGYPPRLKRYPSARASNMWRHK